MKKLLVFVLIIFPNFSLASYQALVNLPGVAPGTASIDTLFNSLYGAAIGLAALLAVVKIVVAGAKWMLTDIVSTKGEAKEDIKGALFGLLIILAAVLIINTVNSNITTVQIQTNSIQKTPINPASLIAGNPKIFIIPANYSLIYKIQRDSAGNLLSGQAANITTFNTNCTTQGLTFSKSNSSMKCTSSSPIDKIPLSKNLPSGLKSTYLPQQYVQRLAGNSTKIDPTFVATFISNCANRQGSYSLGAGGHWCRGGIPGVGANTDPKTGQLLSIPVIIDPNATAPIGP